ncbi:unnamed protein product [Amoebophrya sp. A25]|nr:unnamed protein product [Amoebophrya sp. A25]|eukprot:GSA25T00024079001.1
MLASRAFSQEAISRGLEHLWRYKKRPPLKRRVLVPRPCGESGLQGNGSTNLDAGEEEKTAEIGVADQSRPVSAGSIPPAVCSRTVSQAAVFSGPMGEPVRSESTGSADTDLEPAMRTPICIDDTRDHIDRAKNSVSWATYGDDRVIKQKNPGHAWSDYLVRRNSPFLSDAQGNGHVSLAAFMSPLMGATGAASALAGASPSASASKAGKADSKPKAKAKGKADKKGGKDNKDDAPDATTKIKLPPLPNKEEAALFEIAEPQSLPLNLVLKLGYPLPRLYFNQAALAETYLKMVLLRFRMDPRPTAQKLIWAFIALDSQYRNLRVSATLRGIGERRRTRMKFREVQSNAIKSQSKRELKRRKAREEFQRRRQMAQAANTSARKQAATAQRDRLAEAAMAKGREPPSDLDCDEDGESESSSGEDAELLRAMEERDRVLLASSKRARRCVYETGVGRLNILKYERTGGAFAAEHPNFMGEEFDIERVLFNRRNRNTRGELAQDVFSEKMDSKTVQYALRKFRGRLKRTPGGGPSSSSAVVDKNKEASKRKTGANRPTMVEGEHSSPSPLPRDRTDAASLVLDGSKNAKRMTKMAVQAMSSAWLRKHVILSGLTREDWGTVPVPFDEGPGGHGTYGNLF